MNYRQERRMLVESRNTQNTRRLVGCHQVFILIDHMKVIFCRDIGLGPFGSLRLSRLSFKLQDSFRGCFNDCLLRTMLFVASICDRKIQFSVFSDNLDDSTPCEDGTQSCSSGVSEKASRQRPVYAHPHEVDVGYRTVVELVDGAAVVLMTVLLLDSVLILTPSMYARSKRRVKLFR